MAIYALWNNKGGVGKSYLSFQVAAEYARTHRDQKVLVIDLCPQANSSSVLLGGIIEGEKSPRQVFGDESKENHRRLYCGADYQPIHQPEDWCALYYPRFGFQ
jgi:chromosome partitioning protein